MKDDKLIKFPSRRGTTYLVGGRIEVHNITVSDDRLERDRPYEIQRLKVRIGMKLGDLVELYHKNNLLFCGVEAIRIFLELAEVEWEVVPTIRRSLLSLASADVSRSVIKMDFDSGRAFNLRTDKLPDGVPNNNHWIVGISQADV